MSNRPKVVVTGASSGIGRATAVRFAKEGYDVCLSARRRNLLEELAKELAPGDHLICVGDYSEPAVIDALGRDIDSHWGRLDALVNCAGVAMGCEIVGKPLEEWRKAFDLMFNGGVLVTRMAVDRMREGGRIIHITSIHGERAEVGSSSYSVAKAALNQYCRALAAELAPRGILTNAIAPGFINTPMSVLPSGVSELDTEWFRQNYVEGNHLPLRRPGRPEEIAGVAFFLAGPDATYLTGQVITVDGGLTITF